MNRFAPSLRGRLMWRLALVFTAALIVTIAAFLVAAYRSQKTELHHALEDVAATAVAAIRRDSAGHLVLTQSAGMKAALSGHPGLMMAAVDSTGTAAAGSAPELVPLALELVRSGLETGWFRHQDGGEVIALHATEPAGPVLVVISRGPAGHSDVAAWLWEELGEEVLPIFVPLLTAVLAVTALTLHTSLAPLKRLSRQAAALGPTAVLRLSERAVPDEVLPLIRAVNAGLDRVSASFARQQRFTANAAHELRTPLAVMRARLAEFPEDANRTALIGDIARMTRVVEQLLAVARLESGQIPIDETVDLGELARQTVAALFPLALRAGRNLAVEAPSRPVQVRGNRLALEDALRNLLDNGVRLTAPGTAVDVIVEAGGLIRVADRGPGVAEPLKPIIFEPFQRGRPEERGGAGLGLGIVRETMMLHDGRVWVEDRPGGGAIFVMDFGASLLGKPGEPHMTMSGPYVRSVEGTEF